MPKKYSKPPPSKEPETSPISAVVDERGSATDKPVSMRMTELAFGGLLGLAFAAVLLIFFGERLVSKGEGVSDHPESVASEAHPETVVIPEVADKPAWQRFAAASPAIDQRIPIAIVIDDLGLNPRATRRLAVMDGALTLSFLPYASGLQEQVDLVRAGGHEVMLHLPMEPRSEGQDPGPHALYLGLSEAETNERMTWNLARIEGYVGVNNHMGSEYTENASYMNMVLSAIGAEGLMFLDSRTSAKSVAGELANRMGIATAERDVFLDNDREREAILKALEGLERIANDRGFAVAIGHPYPETMAALESWTKDLGGRGYVLVPITVIIRLTESERLEG